MISRTCADTSDLLPGCGESRERPAGVGMTPWSHRGPAFGATAGPGWPAGAAGADGTGRNAVERPFGLGGRRCILIAHARLQVRRPVPAHGRPAAGHRS